MILPVRVVAVMGLGEGQIVKVRTDDGTALSIEKQSIQTSSEKIQIGMTCWLELIGGAPVALFLKEPKSIESEQISASPTSEAKVLKRCLQTAREGSNVATQDSKRDKPSLQDPLPSAPGKLPHRRMTLPSTQRLGTETVSSLSPNESAVLIEGNDLVVLMGKEGLLPVIRPGFGLKEMKRFSVLSSASVDQAGRIGTFRLAPKIYQPHHKAPRERDYLAIAHDESILVAKRCLLKFREGAAPPLMEILLLPLRTITEIGELHIKYEIGQVDLVELSRDCCIRVKTLLANPDWEVPEPVLSEEVSDQTFTAMLLAHEFVSQSAKSLITYYQTKVKEPLKELARIVGSIDSSI